MYGMAASARDLRPALTVVLHQIHQGDFEFMRQLMGTICGACGYRQLSRAAGQCRHSALW